MNPKLIIAALAALTTGCAVPQFSQLSPEQINAMAKEKTATVQCASVNYLGSNVTTLFVSVDMGRLDGTVQTGPDCATAIVIAKPPAKVEGP